MSALPTAVTGLTVLLAEDEEAIRRLAAFVLRSHGFTVLQAADGFEALEVARRHAGPIHLLLTDWCMLKLDGGELIRRLSQEREEMSVLMMSGTPEVATRCEVPFLTKPFDMKGLLDAVDGALKFRCNGARS